MPEQPERMLSMNELSKELGVSPAMLIAYHNCGAIKADAIAKQAILFKASRVPELRGMIANFGLSRSMSAVARQRK